MSLDHSLCTTKRIHSWSQVLFCIYTSMCTNTERITLCLYETVCWQWSRYGIRHVSVSPMLFPLQFYNICYTNGIQHLFRIPIPLFPQPLLHKIFLSVGVVFVFLLKQLLKNLNEGISFEGVKKLYSTL